MADYDIAKYKDWRSLEVPHRISLALASDSASLVAETSLLTTPYHLMSVEVADLAPEADLPTTVTKINELLDALRDAGLMGSGDVQ
jgi:hypothetical protein